MTIRISSDDVRMVKRYDSKDRWSCPVCGDTANDHNVTDCLRALADRVAALEAGDDR